MAETRLQADKSRKPRPAQTWSTEKTLLEQLEKLWQRGLLLRESIHDSGLFPYRLRLQKPDSKVLGEDFAAVQRWVADIRKVKDFRIEYKTVQHRVIGKNSLPAEAWIDSLDLAIKRLNRQSSFNRFTQLVAQTRQQLPVVLPWVEKNPLAALALAESWPRLLDFIGWRQLHPNPGIYLRQVSLSGIDSKFIEQHRRVLSALLDLALPTTQINPQFTGARQFAQRYGFNHKPETIRFRLLDPVLALLPGKDQDIRLSADDFQACYQIPAFSSQLKRVFITENEINFLSFPKQKNALVIFGAGYGFDALAKVKWLHTKQLFYWGDIDSHGFAILDQLRGKFPHVQSLLMDEATLLAHQPFWVEEKQPQHNTLHHLSPAENKLYQALLKHQYRHNLRLEQERIYYHYLDEVLTQL